jgi:hypothetical protein
MKCPQCGKQMRLEDKDTSSGSDLLTYRREECEMPHIVDCGPALWKVLSDAREAGKWHSAEVP